MKDQMASTDATSCPCAAQIEVVAAFAPLSRRRLAEIAQGAPVKNHERREIERAERLSGVHMPDSCRGCPHADEGWNGRAVCCGGAV